jgi:hypothetical protein
MVNRAAFHIFHKLPYHKVPADNTHEFFPPSKKPARCTNFSNLFWNKTVHVSDSSSVHHQEFCTQQWYMSCRFVDSFRAGAHAPARKPSVWHTPWNILIWFVFLKREFVTMHGHINIKHSWVVMFCNNFTLNLQFIRTFCTLLLWKARG